MSVTLALVIFVPLILFGWLMSQAMPTPRERQLQRLRNRARDHDIVVTLRHVKDPDPDPADRVSSGGKVRDPRQEVAAYAFPMRLPPGVDGRHAPAWRVQYLRNHANAVHDAGLCPGWRFETAGLPLTGSAVAELSEFLADAPAGTVQIEGDKREVALCWRERGEAEEVDAVADLLAGLATWQAALAAQVASAERAARSVDGMDPEG